MAPGRYQTGKLIKKCDDLLEELSDQNLQQTQKNIKVQEFLGVIQQMLKTRCDFDDTQDQLVVLLEELRRQDYQCARTVNSVLEFTFQLLSNAKASELCIFFKVDIDDSECFLRCANETKFLIACKNTYRLGEYMVAVLIDTRAMFSYAVYDKAEHLYGHTKAILRYGLSVSVSEDAGKKSEDILGDVPLSKHSICDLLTFFLLTIYNLTHDEEEPGENQTEVDIIVQCIKQVLKATSSLSSSYMKIRCNTLKLNYEHVVDAIKMVKLSLPELEERLGPKVPDLQHFSRCAVRKALFSNWALPHGIELLEIPDVLKDYLDLKN